MCEKPRRTGTKTGRAADRSPVLPLRAADATPLDLFCRASATTQGEGGNAGRSREDFSHESSREERASSSSSDRSRICIRFVEVLLIPFRIDFRVEIIRYICDVDN